MTETELIRYDANFQKMLQRRSGELQVNQPDIHMVGSFKK